MTIAWGRCSQDDGAPALWPWATILERLGSELPSSAEDDSGDGGAAFRAWESVVATILAVAERAPLMLVLDDLHWADTSSLRVLRLLTEAAAADNQARLLVVATWREHPTPTGALAEVAEALARKHALRLQLRGISAEAAAQVFSQVSESDPSEPDADALRRRTEGNPFFLVEYARLARDGDLASLMAEGRPPAAVHEVVSRRLAHLEGDTQDLLQTASVLGRIFDLSTLAEVAKLDEDTALDRIDPAIEAGLVARGRHRPLPLQPRARARHRPRRSAAVATWPGARPGRAVAHRQSATGRPRSPGTGWPLDRATSATPGRPRRPPRARRWPSTRTSRPWRCSSTPCERRTRTRVPTRALGSSSCTTWPRCSSAPAGGSSWATSPTRRSTWPTRSATWSC